MRKTVLYREKAIPKLGAKKFETNRINFEDKRIFAVLQAG
jgi:hypothetical protein